MLILPKYNNFQQERQVGEYTILLPDPPNLNLIGNKGLPKDKQMFVPTILPKDIAKWERKGREDFEDKEFEKRFNGYWFWNNGNLEWVSGTHYFYINWYYIDIGLPSFVDSDRDWFYMWWYVQNNPKAKGFINLENRRGGKSWRGLCCMYEATSNPRYENKISTIQSKTDDDARKLFKRLVFSWKKMPYFFKPIDVGISNPTAMLEFAEPSKRDTKSQEKDYRDVLNSVVDFAPSGEEALDGTKQFVCYQDEIGKCLAKGTLVLMYDGSLKKVEDVVLGDMLMGDDSTSRTVLNVSSGNEEMFNIIPKKGMVWGCNKSHILSLSVCSDNIVPKCKKGDILNISVSNYLKLSNTAKKHLMLYRVPVAYKSKNNIVDPYLLGLWLGDGSSNDSAITNVDTEITTYIFDWAYKNNLQIKVHKNITYRFYCKDTFNKGNLFLDILKKLDLKKNKHIPNDYLINSSKNRLLLLAGIIDSDGYLTIKGNRQNYEITQKNKLLANQICVLSNSLGFYASINKKVATMRRRDGSIYSCDVYRVNIFGDIYKIPCLVKRKKAIQIFDKHKNTRNHLKSGFKLESIGVGEYYGFTIDRNNLFLLSDYTVTHNTKRINVNKRIQIVSECVVDGTDIVGKIIATTTVEEMEKGGGKHCKEVWDGASPSQLLPNGETQNGLLRYFKPADFGYRGADETNVPFIDKYGYSDRTRAKQFIENKVNSIIKREDKNSYKRKYPLTIKDCWLSDAQKSVYDTDKIDEQMQYNETLPSNILVRGNFVWAGGVVGTEVEWHPCVDGRWLIAWMPDIHSRNKSVIKFGRKSPANTEMGCFGLDPYDNKTTVDDRKSDAASYGFRKFDPMIPNDSGIFILEYVNRPSLPEIMWEDMIMQCVFYGWEILIESNKIGTINYFRMKGYGNYLMARPEETQTNSSSKMEEPGIPMSGIEARQSLVYATESYIINKVGIIKEEGKDSRIGKCYFDKLLENWKAFDFDDEWTKYDSMVGAGLALLGARKYIPKKHEYKHIQLYKKYNNKGVTGQEVK